MSLVTTENQMCLENLTTFTKKKTNVSMLVKMKVAKKKQSKSLNGDQDNTFLFFISKDTFFCFVTFSG